MRLLDSLERYNDELPLFCYADGKRSMVPRQKRLATRRDSVIRALAVATDESYESLLTLVKLNLTPEELMQQGITASLRTAMFEYFGFVKAPQPTSALSLSTVFELLPEDHNVLLEIDGERVASLIDGVLYDLTDWRDEASRKVTGYWIHQREAQILSSTLEGRVVDAENTTVHDFVQPDVVVREPNALASYAFHSRRFDRIWRLDDNGDHTFEATMHVELSRSASSLRVKTQSLHCLPRYIDVINGEAPDPSIDRNFQNLNEAEAVADARRWLGALGLDYDLRDNGTLRLGNALGYRPLTGEIFVVRENKVRANRGFKALRNEMRRSALLKHGNQRGK